MKGLCGVTHDASSRSADLELAAEETAFADAADESSTLPDWQGSLAGPGKIGGVPAWPAAVNRSTSAGDQSADGDGASSDPASSRDVQVRLISLAYSNMLIGLCTDLVCVVTMSWMIAGVVEAGALSIWVGAAAAQMIVRSGIWCAWRLAPSARRRRQVWRYLFIGMSVSMAVLWAVAGTLFMQAIPPGQQIFLIALLLGVSAALMVAAAPEPCAAHSSFVVIGLPVAAGFLTSGQPHFQALGILCIVYTTFLSVVARNYHGLLLRSVTAEVEKTALAGHYQAARLRAEKANDAKSRFLANMSHELRTPLNAINGFSEMMKAGMVKPATVERYQSYAELIHRSGTHLLDLINDVLDLAKAEAGQHVLHEETVDIAALARECVDVVQPAADEGGVLLVDEIQTGSVGSSQLGALEVWVDRRKMRQILLNLLSNAIKFTPNGGTVGVSWINSDDGGLVLYVRDTGMGMTRDQLAEAMKPFIQVDEGYEKRYQGTGLGLPLSKTLVELHGGTLRLESERGRGTIATVWLPEERTTVPDLTTDCDAQA